MADLARTIGQMSAAEAAIYSAMSPAGKQLGLEQVERLMSAVRPAAYIRSLCWAKAIVSSTKDIAHYLCHRTKCNIQTR